MRATYVDFTCDILKKKLSAHPSIRTVLLNSLERPINLTIRKPLQLPLLHSNELWTVRFFLS